MITYQFTTAENQPRIFEAEKWELDRCPSDTDYLEVPLTVLVPHKYALNLGVDYMQKKIVAALDKMVAELNTPTKGETK